MWDTLRSPHSYQQRWQKFATINCVGGKIWGHWQSRLYCDAAHIDHDEEEEVEDGGEVWEEGVEEDKEDEVEAIDGFFDPIAM